MKKTLLTKTLLLLFALIAGSSISWAETVTFNFATLAGANDWENGKAYTSVTIAPITLTAAGGGNNGKYYTSDNSWRMYTGGTVNITAASGYKVTAVSSTPSQTFTISAGAASLACTATIKFTEITVTYTTEGAATVPVTGVSVEPDNWAMPVGDTKQLTATISPAEATNKNVSWESSNDGIATVDKDGVVTAVAEGDATITVTTEDGSKTATCVINVTPAPAVAATLDFTDTGWGFPESYVKTETAYSNAGYTVTLGASKSGHKVMKDGENITALLWGKKDATLTLPAFNFNVSKIKVYGNTGASGKVTFNIFVGEDAVSTEVTSSLVNHDFAIAADKQTAGTVYVIKLTNDNNCQISKIEIFGYVTTPAVTAAGWASYVTPKAVRFAEGEAFAVTAAGSGVVTLAEVTDVPNNFPVLLKGEGAKTALVLETSPAAPTNKLSISNGGSVDGYVLAEPAGNPVGFYKWAGGSLTSGKVYLPASAVAGAPDFLGFDDNATGINAVNGSEFKVNGEYYNLAGQRVAQPTKGLYIVNGKKVVMK